MSFFSGKGSGVFTCLHHIGGIYTWTLKDTFKTDRNPIWWLENRPSVNPSSCVQTLLLLNRSMSVNEAFMRHITAVMFCPKIIRANSPTSCFHELGLHQAQQMLVPSTKTHSCGQTECVCTTR